MSEAAGKPRPSDRGAVTSSPSATCDHAPNKCWPDQKPFTTQKLARNALNHLWGYDKRI